MTKPTNKAANETSVTTMETTTYSISDRTNWDTPRGFCIVEVRTDELNNFQGSDINHDNMNEREAEAQMVELMEIAEDNGAVVTGGTMSEFQATYNA